MSHTIRQIIPFGSKREPNSSPIVWFRLRFAVRTMIKSAGFELGSNPAGFELEDPVIEFPGWYLIKRESDDWYESFFEELRRKYQRRIMQQIVAKQRPLCNSYIASLHLRNRWMNGLWKVVALLNPFRPQYWVLIYCRGTIEQEMVLEGLSRTLTITVFNLWKWEWFHRPEKVRSPLMRFGFCVWVVAARKTMHTPYLSNSVADYISSWNVPMQMRFVAAMDAKSNVSACRGRQGHRRK